MLFKLYTVPRLANRPSAGGGENNPDLLRNPTFLPPPVLPLLLPPLPLPPLPHGQLVRRGWSDDAQAFNAWQMACANAVGLLSAFVERASSSLPTNNCISGSSILQGMLQCTWCARAGSTWSTSPPAYTGLQQWWCCPHTPATGMPTMAMAVGQRGVEEGQGAVGPTICAASVLTARWPTGGPRQVHLGGEKCPGKLGNEHCHAVGRGGGNKGGEAEDCYILGSFGTSFFIYLPT